ncbi:MAG TPA: hypothetical protein VEN82_07265, partial [Actinomycetota bacterium]|nr:hypothetical protein [Actinomycetota bacterium]
GPLSDDEKVRRKKRREHVAAMREAKAARHAFMVGLLAKPVDHDEAIATLVGAWLTPDRRDRGAATGAIAAQLLGLDVPEPKDRWDRPDRRTAVAAFALKSKANVARAALALGFEAAETFIEDPTATYYWPTDAVKAHIELLRSHGYAPSPAERASLAGKAPR